MSKVKELYVGKSIDDLAKKYHQLPKDLHHKSMNVILHSVDNLIKEAERYRLLGDQEMSYILYMKYFGLIQKIRERPDYSKQKKYISEILSNDTIRIAMDHAEDLAKKLKQRYDELTPKITNNNNQSTMNYNNNEPSSANSSNSNLLETLNTVHCEDLFKMIQDRSESILIMDCRPKIDYSNSHLLYSDCLNVPQEILVPGQSAGSIQNQLEERPKWAARAIKNHIILMDWDCKSGDPPYKSPIWILKDILMNWDQDVTYRSTIKIVLGGYENFILMYPNQCSNPVAVKPSSFIPESDFLDEIEYPSINDIVMKDDSVFDVSMIEKNRSIPTVDRKSKLAAVKTYNEKQGVLEYMNETETIIDKNLQNKNELTEAEIEWETLKTLKNTEPMGEKYRKNVAKEQELIYRILQLESKDKDLNIKVESKLNKIEQLKKEIDEQKTAQEIEKQNLAQERIEFKMQQQKKIDADRERDRYKREMKKIEREKTLEEAKEKRHLPPPETEENEIIKPKIPQIDRSIKPNFNQNIEEFQRDFSPEHGQVSRGLTGLKNLGNTCYMNSILQCLSNTNLFTDYILKDTYKNQINRKNKTKGQIIEEVAALIKVLWSGNYKAVSSRNLRYVFGQFQQIFSGFEQQDSHEFLTILIDWLHLDLQTLNITQNQNARLNASQKSWLDFTKSCESYILRLFYGQIKSTVKCRECGVESATYDCFSNLSLELPGNANSCYIENCLYLYFNGEEINGWNCPKCKQKRNAIKKLSISNLPPVLVIHLKRFYADPDGNSYKKKQNYVKFHLDGLDLRPFISKYEQSLSSSKIYSLYAVSNHYGSMESGHYTAFCKNNLINKWAKYDDSVVSIIDSSDIVSSAAYILFYIRNSDS